MSVTHYGSRVNRISKQLLNINIVVFEVLNWVNVDFLFCSKIEDPSLPYIKQIIQQWRFLRSHKSHVNFRQRYQTI